MKGIITNLIERNRSKRKSIEVMMRYLRMYYRVRIEKLALEKRIKYANH